MLLVMQLKLSAQIMHVVISSIMQIVTCSTAQHSTAQHSTAQRSAAQQAYMS